MPYAYAAPILLLFCSNIFMTFAWYGQLRYPGAPLWLVVLVSWGIAFFEYCLAVPANRIGHQVYSTAQLKTMQEIITLIVFAVFSVTWLGEALAVEPCRGVRLFCAARRSYQYINGNSPPCTRLAGAVVYYRVHGCVPKIRACCRDWPKGWRHCSGCRCFCRLKDAVGVLVQVGAVIGVGLGAAGRDIARGLARHRGIIVLRAFGHRIVGIAILRAIPAGRRPGASARSRQWREKRILHGNLPVHGR